MEQIYMRTPCQSLISVKVLCNFIEIALWHGCSPVNLLHIFRTPFPKKTCGGGLLLKILGAALSYLFDHSNEFPFWTNDKFINFKLWIGRSSPPKMFLGKGVLKICSKFTREHPWRSVISLKLQNNFNEITLWHGCSSVNLLHIFIALFSKNNSEGLLLKWMSFEELILSHPFFSNIMKYTRKLALFSWKNNCVNIVLKKTNHC